MIGLVRNLFIRKIFVIEYEYNLTIRPVLLLPPKEGRHVLPLFVCVFAIDDSRASSNNFSLRDMVSISNISKSYI